MTITVINYSNYVEYWRCCGWTKVQKHGILSKINYVNLKEVNNDVIANILQLYSPCFVPAFTLGCCPVACGRCSVSQRAEASLVPVPASS